MASQDPRSPADPPSGPPSAPDGADPLACFQEPVRGWFSATFPGPTRAQALAWPLIASGRTALILSPTGSGKTLAAFLSAIDRLMFDPVPAPEDRCRVLYVSPLKALAVDVERNLRAPLLGVARRAEAMGRPFHLPEIAVRTGDTPARERARFARRPGDVLITTPESLYLLLTTSARAALRPVRCVILDELHALVGSKRGAHLLLSLERLGDLCGAPLQRVGLSATVRPIDEAARFLGGYEARGDLLVPREVAVADARAQKRLDLRVEIPVADMARLRPATAEGAVQPSIWPAIHPLLLDLIRRHRSTLIFVNSRRLSERLAGALNELAAESAPPECPAAGPIVRAHHGSIARPERQAIEEDLKAGALPALVATSSLELGIDMGAIDLVVQVEAPPSVSSALQRIGRAGHTVDMPSKGVILPKHRGDLLACAALVQRMHEGAVEPQRSPQNPLDVLAQQIVALVTTTTTTTPPPPPGGAHTGPDPAWRVDDVFALVRRAAPFAGLSRPLFEGVLDLLSGRYPSDEFTELRPRLTWDRVSGVLRPRHGARRVALLSGGTIPDRGLYGVFLVEPTEGEARRRSPSRRVGELDEEMVLESRPGDTFILGASSWRIEEITHDRVLVSPAPGQAGRMPFWRGEGPGRPLEFGRAIGALSRTLRELPAQEARDLLMGRHQLSEGAADNLLRYLEEQAAAGAVPDDRTLVLEHHRDELGDARICLLSPLGSQVHGPWALALLTALREQGRSEPDILWTDDGLILRFPGGGAPPPAEALIPDPEQVEGLVMRQLGGSALFAARFREAAARALLLPRRYPGQRTALWQQRRRAADLLRAASRFPSFPMVLEAYRECLRDVFDIPALVDLLREVRAGRVRLREVSRTAPSPFAASLLFNYAANFLYEGDAPLAERRAQALLVDPARLRELLGDVELGELLDEETVRSLEAQLQHLTPERKARRADAVHDLLLRLGDLSAAEVAARSDPPEAAAAWLEGLREAGRVVPLPIAGEERHVAVEDAARYRDALGVALPPGLPAALLGPAEGAQDPLVTLVGRYARTHGPFTVEAAASRLGLGVEAVRAALAALEGQGRLARVDGLGRRADPEVLRLLQQRALQRLRREVEPVPAEALGRLYLSWHGVGQRRGGEALLEVIEQLQGVPLPASVLEEQILPARMSGYEPHDLDRLLAEGAVRWVGCEALGEHDGRVALYLAEHAALLMDRDRDRDRDRAGGPARGPDRPLHHKLRQVLRERGALFFPQIQAACGGFSQDTLAALWDLVWAGEVTNDTLQPLRAYVSPPRERARRPGLPRLTGRGFRGAQSEVPREAGGRWTLVEHALGQAPGPVPGNGNGPDETERAAALAQQLLMRHGVLTREAVQAEGGAGGFGAIYPVLKAMEERGQVRRGYFVAGLGATQFALPGAVEQLRLLRQPAAGGGQAVVLSATDPANPYGAALPWPERAGRRPGRAAGALVVIVEGALAAWVARGEESVLTFLEEEGAMQAVARALAGLVGGRRRALLLKEVDGGPVAASALGAALLMAGFSPGAQGYRKTLSI